METYLASSNYNTLPVFMSVKAQNSSTRQNDNSNIKESKSTTDIFYSFILPPNKPFNGFRIAENTKDVNFNTEDITKIVESPSSEHSEYKGKANILLAVQDSEPDTIVDAKQYTMLKIMLQEEIPESGISNPSEKIVECLYSENRQKTNILLNELFIKNFHNLPVIIGVLHIISHFEYGLVSPEGQTMAIAALTHQDVEVREYGVKCFENWQHQDGIRILEHIKANEQWFQNYINLVIHDLKNP
jgi:hypothetical protein